MSEKRRGLGKGLGALIPSGSTGGRPSDVFFQDSPTAVPAKAADGSVTDGATTSSATSGPEVPAHPAPRNGSGADDGAVVTDAADDGDGLLRVPGAEFAVIPIDDVVANRRQPRQSFDEDELEELAASIRQVGVLQPVVVRADAAGGYELIMGERRLRASELAGQETIPAIIRDVEDDNLLRDALLENLHRADLNPLEEAAAYQQLLDDFACTHEELASRIARSRPQISNTLRLLKLPAVVQRRVAAGVLSAGHARALLGLTDAAAMERLAQRIVAEGLSVRSTEEIIALGEEPMTPELRRRPRAGEHEGALDDLATKLADRFDTRVKIAMGQRKGRINIEFASVADLNRILEVLAPDAGTLPVD